jgi:predicted RNA methylase
VDLYGSAIRSTVKKGDLVLDIGSGSGILPFLSAKAEALRVYAVEPGEIVLQAKELARLNRMDEQITFMPWVTKTEVSPQLCRGDSQGFDRALQ